MPQPPSACALDEGLGLNAVLHHYCGLEWCQPPAAHQALRLRNGQPSGLLFEAFPAPGKPPRYREAIASPSPDDTVGYLIEDQTTHGRLAVLPSVACLNEPILERLQHCDAILFDGTFWSENELAETGAGETPASRMGHLPVGGAGGSLRLLASLPARHKIYLHINNTNPILIEDSPERQEVENNGVQVAWDGLELEL